VFSAPSRMAGFDRSMHLACCRLSLWCSEPNAGVASGVSCPVRGILPKVAFRNNRECSKALEGKGNLQRKQISNVPLS
jgi:hypothetical protein